MAKDLEDFVEIQIELMDKTMEQAVKNAIEFHRSYCPNQGSMLTSIICEQEFMENFTKLFLDAVNKKTMQNLADRNPN